MKENFNLSPEILLHIAETLNLPMRGLVAVIELLDDGGTVPFIARYRKEATGNLDEVQIRDIEEKLAYFRDLTERRATILASIAEQGKLTDELKARIEATLDKNELEDLYLPYKPKRRTKATIAREKGLEPLALYLWEQEAAAQTLTEFAAGVCECGAGRRRRVDEALEGARHIVAEWMSEDADLRKALRKLMFDEGAIVSRKVTDATDEQEKFKMYYEYTEPVKTIPSHRMLAIRRGESENVLYFLIELGSRSGRWRLMRRHVLRAQGDWTPQLELAIDDAWKRLLNSSIQAEIRMELKRRSDTDAIAVFRDNLYNLLLAPPAGPISVLGIDPGTADGMQGCGGGCDGKDAGARRAVSAYVEARQRGGGAEAGGAAAPAQCARDCDWEWNGIAGDGCVCARVFAREEDRRDFFGDGERVGREYLLGVGRGAAGVSGS